jgi:hypothetical protein
MSSWIDYFIGTSQSRYAFFAIFSALVAICMAIIFTNNDISLAQRIIIVLFVLFVSIFPVGISLFELTCMVNGGNTKSGFNACSSYAWVVTAMIIVYCFFLVIATLISMFTYKKAVAKIEISKHANAISDTDANTIAKNMIDTTEEKDRSHDSFVGMEAPNAPQIYDQLPVSNDQLSVSNDQLPVSNDQQEMSSPQVVPSEVIHPTNSQVMGGTYEQFGGGVYETFEQKKAKNNNNIVGHSSADDFMHYERETFANAPRPVVKSGSSVSKKHVKKEHKVIDENEPKPYVDQIENFATI